MSSQEDARRFIPPSGACVPPASPEIEIANPGYEAHVALDRGESSDILIAAAASACISCVQWGYCESQFNEITDVMWLAGVEGAVVAGRQRENGPTARQVLDVDAVPLKFDLSELPREGEARLGFIRRGVKADQLTIVSNAPKNATVIAEGYRRLLHDRDEKVLLAFTETLTPVQQERALRYITMTLCQQADFKQFSQHVRSSAKGADNARYNPETHDYEINYDAVRVFIGDVTRIKEMGFENPGEMAIRHSVEYTKMLVDEFGQLSTSRTVFYQVVRANVRDPYRALLAYSASLQAQRTSGAGLTETNAQRNALTHKPATKTGGRSEHRTPDLGHRDRIAEAERLYGTDHPIVTPKIIATLSKLRSGHMDRLRAYEEVYGTLLERHDKDRDFSPAIISHYALQADSRGLMMARVYKERLDLWRTWASLPENQGHQLKDSFLREHARDRDAGSYEDLLRAHAIKVLQTRYNARNGRRGEEDKVPIETWMLNRIVGLYPLNDVEDVGDVLYSMLADHVLSTSVAELSTLQDPVIRLNVDGISDPTSRKYVTFGETLKTLTPGQRLALAYDLNITRLLYGELLDETYITNLLRNEKDRGLHQGGGLPGYGVDHVLATAVGNAGDPGHSSKPLPFSVIKSDVVELLRANPSEASAAGDSQLESMVSVVGGQVVHLAQFGERLSALEQLLPAEYGPRIREAVVTSYPPREQRAAVQNVITGLRGERLTIVNQASGDSLPIALSRNFYTNDLDDVDRAVVAHVMGVGRLLYGLDLELTLRYRLSNSSPTGTAVHNITGYLAENVLPKVKPWETTGDVARTINATPQALLYILGLKEYPDKDVWAVEGTPIGISTSLASDIGGRQYSYASRPGWTPYHVLASERRGLSTALNHVPIGKYDQQVCRAGNSKTLELYFSPELTGRLWAATT